MSAERKPGYFVRGDLVETWFDDGRGGCYVYGDVIAAGRMIYRVRWESGLTQRFNQGRHDIKRARDEQEATAALKRRAAVLEGASSHG